MECEGKLKVKQSLQRDKPKIQIAYMDLSSRIRLTIKIPNIQSDRQTNTHNKLMS